MECALIVWIQDPRHGGGRPKTPTPISKCRVENKTIRVFTQADIVDAGVKILMCMGVKFNMTPNGERQKKWSSPFLASRQNFDAASSVCENPKFLHVRLLSGTPHPTPCFLCIGCRAVEMMAEVNLKDGSAKTAMTPDGATGALVGQDQLMHP